jgi:DNA-binding protein YbaB
VPNQYSPTVFVCEITGWINQVGCKTLLHRRQQLHRKQQQLQHELLQQAMEAKLGESYLCVVFNRTQLFAALEMR